MKHVTTILAMAAASSLIALAGPAGAQGQQSNPSASSQGAGNEAKGDAKRMQKLAQDNLAEIEAGKLAADKAQDPQVKQFAQRMVDDHTKMLDDLKKLAQSKHVDLPTAPDAKHQKLMSKLQSLSGDKFDREYMRAMVKDHRDTLKQVQRTAKSAKDADLKNSAQQAAPEIQDHLKMAQDISKSEKSQKRSASGQTGQPNGAQSQAGTAR